MEIFKKTYLWKILRKIKKAYQRFDVTRWKIEKCDGKQLTPSLQREIQEIVKKNLGIYFLTAEKAKNLTNNLHCTIDGYPPSSLRYIKDAIPIVLCANNDFAPYMAVMLQSLLDNSNSQRKYHFIIFEQDFTDKTKKLLTKQISSLDYCTIDFINTKNALKEIPSLPYKSRFSKDIFSRFLIPYWLDKYPKVIYCDSDMLAKADIAELYDFDIQSYCIGAVVNQWVFSNINKQKYSAFANFAVFTILDNWSNYINSGLLLFNTKIFKEKFSFQDLYKFTIYYINRYKKIFPDQDILSLLIKNNFYQLPPEWNHCWEKSIKADAYPFGTKETNAKIIHFTSSIKPWKNLPEIANNPDAISYKDYAKNVALYNLIHSKENIMQ